MHADFLWPVVALAFAGLAWNILCRWLERGSVEFQKLSDKYDKLYKEHAESLAEWSDKFAALEQRLDRGDAKLDNALRNLTGANDRRDPRGAHYNVRG